MNTNALKCPTCKKILNLPVILPCGHTICKHHVDKAVENNETNIKCNICDKFIDIPTNGFVQNRAFENLLDEMRKSSFGKKFKSEYNLAVKTSDSFEELLEELNRIKNDPEIKINTVISELRNKVDLKREEMKQEIDRKALTLIERIDEFEKECKANASNVKSDCKLDETLDRLKNDLNETRKSSLTLELVEKWMKIADESKSAIKEIQSELLKFNESLFLNRLNSFDCINLSVLNVQFQIKLTIKGLSRYKDSIEPEFIDIATNTVKAYGIEWLLFVRIEKVSENGSKENYFGIYLCANQNPRIQYAKVDFDLEILDQFRMGENKNLNFSYLFNSELGWGRKAFISLKDLLSNYNLYNIEDDSCTVQALIKQIEWI